MSLRFTAAAGLIMALAVVGCGSKDQPIKVSGVLTWEDGTPIDQALVEFIPQGEGKAASGFTGKDGSFDLTTTNSGDGALPGPYKVVVIKRDVQKSLAAGAGPPKDVTEAMAKFAGETKGPKKAVEKGPDSLLPAIYAAAGTTPLKWTVESGGPRVELKLKKS